MEHALPYGERDPNRHHNLPQSRGGSNEENNVSIVDPHRHDLFHQSWGSNAIPTELVRYMALHSIGHPDAQKRLSPSHVRALFDATHAPDWGEYYYDDSTVSASTVNGVIRALQNIRITSNMLAQEKAWVSQTVSAIRGEGDLFPMDEHLLLPNAMKFFEAKTPSKAIEEFLDERDNGEFSWTKPLRHQKRAQIQRILADRSGTAMDNRKDHVHLLLEHHKTLDLQSREVERTIAKLDHELRKLLQMIDLRPLEHQ